MRMRRIPTWLVTLAVSGLLLANSCQFFIDPAAALAVVDGLRQCDIEFDDGSIDEIDCNGHNNHSRGFGSFGNSFFFYDF